MKYLINKYASKSPGDSGESLLGNSMEDGVSNTVGFKVIANEGCIEPKI
jgi:hypothetical protein